MHFFQALSQNFHKFFIPLLVKSGCNKTFLLQPLFWGERKIAQIGQTELIMPMYRHYQVTRRRTWVRREAKFVQNTRRFIAEIHQMTNFHLNFCFILTLQQQQKALLSYSFALCGVCILLHPIFLFKFKFVIGLS